MDTVGVYPAPSFQSTPTFYHFSPDAPTRITPGNPKLLMLDMRDSPAGQSLAAGFPSVRVPLLRTACEQTWSTRILFHGPVEDPPPRQPRGSER